VSNAVLVAGSFGLIFSFTQVRERGRGMSREGWREKEGEIKGYKFTMVTVL